MNFPIHRGVNIAHWLSQSPARGEKRRRFFQREHVFRLRDDGFDHLRLPIDEEQMWAEDGRRETEAFDLLQAALGWLSEAGMRAVVDLHILRAHHFLDHAPALFSDPRAAAHLGDLWADLSDALHPWPLDAVAYELMNEPVATDNADWNRVARIPFRAIRDREPQRTVVLGSNHFCQVQTFDDLEVPDDGNLILTFHYYLPMPLTHYRASWAPHQEAYAGPVHYPGVPILPEDEPLIPAADRAYYATVNAPYDRARIAADLAKPLAVAARTGQPLYCGEFGVISLAPEAARLRWYRDMVDVLAEYKIAWAAWDWRGAFAVHDAAGQPTAALRGLMGRD